MLSSVWNQLLGYHFLEELALEGLAFPLIPSVSAFQGLPLPFDSAYCLACLPAS